MHHMSRIYAPVDEPTLEQIDQDAKEKGISRAQWVSTAIESILHQEAEILRIYVLSWSKHAPKGKRPGESWCN
jgi:hypothetical protein